MQEISEFPIKKLPFVFWKYRFHCFLIVLSITAGTAVYTLFKPNTYAAVVTIMNIDNDKTFSGSGNMLQIFGLAKEKNEGFHKFTAIMGSRTFKEKMVESLGPEFFTPKEGWKEPKEALHHHALGVLAGSIRWDINPMQSNILNIVVEMEDERLPTAIANQVPIVLQEYIANHSLTKAKTVRKYVEDSILETKAAIFETANTLSSFHQTYAVNAEQSMINFPLQKELAKLNAKEGEEAFGDPLLRESFKNLNEKKEHLAKRLEKIRAIPEKLYFDYLEEEFQILKNINLTLRQQYEIAKLEDVKQEPAFQILDKAQPARKSGPRRKFMTLVGFAFSTLLACFYVLAKTFFQPSPVR